MNLWSDYLRQIELAAHGAPPQMLGLLMDELASALAEAPEELGEYGRLLLLKLDHLLTQQQVRAAQAGAAAPGYLAPNLVIRDSSASRQVA